MLLGVGSYRVAPAQVGRFTVHQVSEQRATGMVVEAHDPADDKYVTIQLIRPGGDVSPADHMRGIGEALGSIRSPNIVRVHDVGVVDAYVYLAMERLSGTSVQAWLRTERPAGAWRQTLRAFKQAALGLYAVHRAGFVHGDFSPASVFLGADGQVHVRDLGQMRPSGSPGVLVGEPAYAAPEVIAGARVDERADQFSFCATMFETLYGTRPFPGDDPLHVVNAIRAGHVERPPAGFDGPPRLLDVLRRGLREDPGARWRDMMQLVQEIDRVVPQEAGPRPRRRVAWGLVVGLLLAKLAAVVASNTGACVSQG